MLNIKDIFNDFCYIVVDDNKIIKKISMADSDETYNLEIYVKNTLILQSRNIVTHDEVCSLLQEKTVISMIDKNNLAHLYDIKLSSFVC